MKLYQFRHRIWQLQYRIGVNKVIDLKWMLECTALHRHRMPNHLCGKHLTVGPLRWVGTFDFSLQIHCRKLRDTADNEWILDGASRQISLVRWSLGPDDSIRTSNWEPGKKEMMTIWMLKNRLYIFNRLQIDFVPKYVGVHFCSDIYSSRSPSAAIRAFARMIVLPTSSRCDRSISNGFHTIQGQNSFRAWDYYLRIGTANREQPHSYFATWTLEWTGKNRPASPTHRNTLHRLPEHCWWNRSSGTFLAVDIRAEWDCTMQRSSDHRCIRFAVDLVSPSSKTDESIVRCVGGEYEKSFGQFAKKITTVFDSLTVLLAHKSNPCSFSWQRRSPGLFPSSTAMPSNN